MGFEVKIGRNPWGDISSGRLLSLPPQGPFFILTKSVRACLYQQLISIPIDANSLYRVALSDICTHVKIFAQLSIFRYGRF